MDARYRVTIEGELDERWTTAIGIPVSVRVGEGLTELVLGPADQGELLLALSVLAGANLQILGVARLDGLS